MSSGKQEQVKKILKSLEAFKGFSPEELTEISSQVSLSQSPKETWIVRKKEGRKHCYLLLKGKAELVLNDSEDNKLSVTLGTGDWFGQGCRLFLEMLQFPIFSKTECMLICFPEDWSEFSSTTSQRLEELLFKSLNNNLKCIQEAISSKIPSIEPARIVEEVKAPPPPEEKIEEEVNSLEEEAEEEVEEEEEEEPNPFAIPTGEADYYNEEITTQEDYDVMLRKIHLRTEFIFNKLPNVLIDMIINKLFGYWTGGKLARVNPHCIWNPKSFTPGTPRLLKALHLVVLHSNGEELYDNAYLKLPFSHRVVGLPETGCMGTFLGSDDAIERYFKEEKVKDAIKLDFEIPIDRVFNGKDSIEFLTHTCLDVRDQTLFLVFDDRSGKNTLLAREKFPNHQIITVVDGLSFDPEEPSSVFSLPEETLVEEGNCVPKKDFNHIGFYLGETYFLPDFSTFFKESNLNKSGYIFTTIGLLTQIGPDYSGVVWGSKGGAEGAVRASKAMFGMKGAQSQDDITKAIQWADE
jgi:hypothetical protein